MSYFRSKPETGVTSPSQIAIVGDRLFTDVMMANMMGAYGFWIRDGVVEEKGLVSSCDTCFSIAVTENMSSVRAYGKEACWLPAASRTHATQSPE